MVEATSSSWKVEVLSSEKPVVVEFYTPTCPFCRRLAPIFESLSAEYSGRILFAKVDASVEKDLATGKWQIPGHEFERLRRGGRPQGI